MRSDFRWTNFIIYMRLIFLLLAVLMLNSCCGRVICDCWDDWHDAIGFEFVHLPSEGGFDATEIDTIRLYRLDKSHIVLDSLELYRDTSNYGTEEFMTFDSTRYLLMLGGWMGIYGTQNKIDLNENDFRIRLLDGTSFDITDIALETETHKVNRCCECPTNVKKTFKVNGADYDLTGKKDLGEIAIELKK